MNKYVLISIIQSIILFSCSNNKSTKSNVDDIITDSTIMNNPRINWVTDESDILIPDKRKTNLKADAFRMGLKGNVMKIEVRHYEASMEHDMMTVSNNLANISPLGGRPDCPSNENSLIDDNHDIYFDHDGFKIKEVVYDNNGVKCIYYRVYDPNGNELETKIQDNKGLRVLFGRSEYHPEKYKPEPKDDMVISGDGTITTYFTYDHNKNVILETKRDNINGKLPYLGIRKFLYEYDEKGNWTSRTYLIKDASSNSPFFPVGVARRTIHYW